MTEKLFEHLFRREYGNMVAALTRYFGIRHLDLVEDVVQETLCRAMENWKYHGWPANPAGWLYRAARNKALDVLRRNNLFHEKIIPSIQWESRAEKHSLQEDEIFLEGEISDDVLRMMFACSHPSLPEETRTALILKLVCGFSSGEVARAFLQDEESIKKKIFRAKKTLMQKGKEALLTHADGKLESVCAALYLLFNEGYHSSHAEQAVREDLCYEAFRLALLLYEHPPGRTGKVGALCALMCFLAARLPSRSCDDGSLVLLKYQDRSQWNARLITKGMEYLQESDPDKGRTRYHLEAGLAACHCMAKDFESTEWGTILQLYNRLLEVHPSPVVELNRAVVFWQLEGAGRALEEIEKIDSSKNLNRYSFYHATLGELYKDTSQIPEARDSFNRALQLAVNPGDRQLLKEKIEGLENRSKR